MSEALTVHQEEQRTPTGLIALAIEKGMSPDNLEKLFSMQERYERNKAAERFGEALAQFQRLCPKVQKKREAKNRTGQVMYKYASFEDCEESAKPHLATCGISYSFEIEEEENKRTIAVRLQVGAHAEDRCYPFVTADKTGMMDDAKQYASSLSQAKRHAFCAALGVTVADEEEAPPQRERKFIDGDQAITLHELVRESGADLVKFLAWADAASIGQIVAAKYSQAETLLKAKSAGRKKEGGAA